ncbi:hypothetical protein F511_26309 [Dorcoceras hygrometricum]|uniref:Uncharacterized protein n=1 Tax=Dorcoceras hygrometricum TaxID=472368 RepID=A0A2Z7BVN1_9LAMI|nr:hypothetical protein F511_26309 [Dorcoceras hygrometricum]
MWARLAQRLEHQIRDRFNTKTISLEQLKSKNESSLDEKRRNGSKQNRKERSSLESTTIGKSRFARDPITMHTSWRSNSDIAYVTRYPRTRASDESSTTKHRLLHASDLTQPLHLMTPTESVNGSK